METGLAGRTVIISGAARNIGRETALMLAAEGANLALCTASSVDRLEAVADEVRALGSKAITAQCDVADDDAVQNFVDATLSEFGRIDVTINNAVFRGEADYYDIDADMWERNIAVNLTGPHNLCRRTIPHMQKAGWGRVINYSGISPYVGHGPAKAMVKLGIVGFTRGLATEFAEDNITANCIAPGLIDVERESWQRDKPVPDAQPIRRHGTSKEIASLAVYLASENAAFITGQCYMANGGNYLS